MKKREFTRRQDHVLEQAILEDWSLPRQMTEHQKILDEHHEDIRRENRQMRDTLNAPPWWVRLWRWLK